MDKVRAVTSAIANAIYIPHILYIIIIFFFGSVDPKQVGPRCRSQSVAVLWHVGDGEDSQSWIPCPTHF